MGLKGWHAVLRYRLETEKSSENAGGPEYFKPIRIWGTSRVQEVDGARKFVFFRDR